MSDNSNSREFSQIKFAEFLFWPIFAGPSQLSEWLIINRQFKKIKKVFGGLQMLVTFALPKRKTGSCRRAARGTKSSLQVLFERCWRKKLFPENSEINFVGSKQTATFALRYRKRVTKSSSKGNKKMTRLKAASAVQVCGYHMFIS